MGRHVVVRAASTVGVLFSALAVVAGARVLTGIDRPDYVVLPWLVGYNLAAGIIGVVAGAGLWWLRQWAVALAWVLAALHASVLLGLIAWRAGEGVVANDSLVAMTLRTVVWAAIAIVAHRAAGAKA